MHDYGMIDFAGSIAHHHICGRRCTREKVQQWWCLWNILCCVICESIWQHKSYHHTWEAHGCFEERQEFHLDEVCYSSGWDFEDWHSISCKFWYLILHVYCSTLFANVNVLAIVELFKNLFSNASYFWRWIWFVFKTELENTYLNEYSKES